MEIQEAAIVGISETSEGQEMAIVEIKRSNTGPNIIAFMQKDSRGNIQVSRAEVKEADYQTDWFDNNLHQTTSSNLEPKEIDVQQLEKDLQENEIWDEVQQRLAD